MTARLARSYLYVPADATERLASAPHHIEMKRKDDDDER
jgi:hypothetical protein